VLVLLYIIKITIYFAILKPIKHGLLGVSRKFGGEKVLKKSRILKFIDKMQKELFWNDILIVLTEGYIEFLIAVMLFT